MCGIYRKCLMNKRRDDLLTFRPQVRVCELSGLVLVTRTCQSPPWAVSGRPMTKADRQLRLFIHKYFFTSSDPRACVGGGGGVGMGGEGE